MKYRFFAFILMTALASGIVNAGARAYSATATAEIRFYGGGDLINSYPSAKSIAQSAEDTVNEAAAQIVSMESLNLIVHQLKLNRAWSQRSKSNSRDLADQETIGRLRGMIHIDFPEGNTFIHPRVEEGSTPQLWYLEFRPLIFKITVDSEVPQEAATIANAVVDNYKAMRDHEEDERNKQGMNVLREEITEQQKVVDDEKVKLKKQQQQLLLNALKIRLEQDIADINLTESPVRIISRASHH